MLVTINNRLKFEIEIVHVLSCHPIVILLQRSKFSGALVKVTTSLIKSAMQRWDTRASDRQRRHICLSCNWTRRAVVASV